ncbi:MAG: type 1 glutamine amidotransferase-like domain-containing protein [Lachnospiraceae bacterium]|nr:type 1 glutamine amidotransferase-like domain-containing protein [Lachnospiraceae bacterium]
MKVILTSSLGGSMKVDGRRIPIPLMGENGQLDQIEVFWRENSRILLISGTPDDYTRNDAIINCLKESFRMSGLEFSFFEMCDARTEGLVERLSEMDVILLGGGHVPTQNAFMKRIGLKERLRNYEGLIIGGSAGSMNCAELVYAGPESEEEAVDPNYQRWISGLGMTQVNILPHFQRLKGVVLGGLRLIEDITYADSIGHGMIALNDGSYIVVDDGAETLYGEAYSIKDGCRKQICRNGESIAL